MSSLLYHEIAASNWPRPQQLIAGEGASNGRRRPGRSCGSSATACRPASACLPSRGSATARASARLRSSGAAPIAASPDRARLLAVARDQRLAAAIHFPSNSTPGVEVLARIDFECSSIALNSSGLKRPRRQASATRPKMANSPVEGTDQWPAARVVGGGRGEISSGGNGRRVGSQSRSG
jgi:hypothetical protein